METFSALLALCAENSPVPVNSPLKGQWRGALMFSLICIWINDRVNNREAGDLRRHRGHYDVTVMKNLSVWKQGRIVICDKVNHLCFTVDMACMARLISTYLTNSPIDYLLFSLQYMGLYVFNWPISVLGDWKDISTAHVIIIIKSEVSTVPIGIIFFPWLCAWDVCYIIFSHLLHIRSGKNNIRGCMC